MEKNLSLMLDKEFIEYCELNKIEDITKLAAQVFQRGFTLLKYGETPPETLIDTMKRSTERAKIDPAFAKEIVDNAQTAIEGYRKDHESLYGE